jgi:hypothetical protein
MTVYAISSSCTDVAIAPGDVLALAKSLARCARWWSLPTPHVVYTTRIGELDDPGAIDVHIVPDWSAPQFAGIPAQDIAYHTVGPDGRAVCYISWAAVQVNGGTLRGPNGLWSAISHECLESLVDPLCTRVVVNPAGQQEPVEVCDRLEDDDYEEDGSPGVWLANALKPAGFGIYTPGTIAFTGPRDIAGDLRPSPWTMPFPLADGGYYAPVDGPPVFGERAPEHLKERVGRLGARSGAVRAAQATRG